MTKVKKEDSVTPFPSNIEGLEGFIQNCASEMADIDAARRKLNKQASEIREALKEKGLDRDAFRDVYGYYKKRRHEKDGYDESHKVCMDALNKMDTGNLFDFLTDKE